MECGSTTKLKFPSSRGDSGMSYKESAEELEAQIAELHLTILRKRATALYYRKEDSILLDMAGRQLEKSADRLESQIPKMEQELAEIRKLLEWEGA